MKSAYVAFALDDLFLVPTVVAVHSLLRHWPADLQLHLVFLTRSVSQDSVQKLRLMVEAVVPGTSIKIIDADSVVADLPAVGHLTSTTYCRFYLPDLLPHADEVLYLDGDILVTADLSNTPSVKGVLARASLDSPDAPVRLSEALPYCTQYPGFHPELPLRNMGVLLINAREWRTLKVSQGLTSFVRQYGDVLRLADQDALNAVCGYGLGDLPATWNRQIRNWPHPAETKVIHYSGWHKPWNSGFTHPAIRLWLREARHALTLAGINYQWWAFKRFVRATKSAIVARMR